MTATHTAARPQGAAERFCCPSCHSDLAHTAAGFECWRCARHYPIRFGIVDFRIVPDPYIGVCEEMEKTERVAALARRATFEEMVRYYWRITPDVQAEHSERFIDYACRGVARGRPVVDQAAARLGASARQACLDIGCGTGGLLVAAGDTFTEVVGVDIAMRWLVIARQRLDECGRRATLVCACAEALPFRPESFDAVFGVDLLEHTTGPREILGEVRRVLRPGATYFFSSPNRFSLGPEPCVRVWGVGLLPRHLAARYVQLVRGVPYRHIALLSAWELRRLLREVGLDGARVEPGRIADVDRDTLSRVGRLAVRLYNRLCQLPLLRGILRLCGPLLHAAGNAPETAPVTPGVRQPGASPCRLAS